MLCVIAVGSSSSLFFVSLANNDWSIFVADDKGERDDAERDEIEIDRATGDLTFRRFKFSSKVKTYPSLEAGDIGKEFPLPFEYTCQKPHRA